MQLYQSERSEEAVSAGPAPSLPPFPVLLRVPYYAAEAGLTARSAPREDRPVETPAPLEEEAVPAAEVEETPPAAPATAPNPPSSPRRGKLAVGMLLLVALGLGAHWYFTSMRASLVPSANDPAESEEMVIEPLPEPTPVDGPAPAPAEVIPAVDPSAPPVRALLDPNIIPVEEKAP